MGKIRYSWILPVYNEAISLTVLLSEIKQAMTPALNWEIIAINDASKDQSLKILQKLVKTIPQLKILHLNKHQGKWLALSLGIKSSKGHFIITIDSDLQDDPAEISKLLKKLHQGYDLVSGWRENRQDLFYKVLISKLGNILASFLNRKYFKDLNSPFKVYRRQVLDNLPQSCSMFRFSMLFADRLGYKVTEVPINHRSRPFGKSKFGIVKYLRIIYDLILILLLFSGSGRIENLKSLSKMPYKEKAL
jgi:glycosyltransferase involved in cell wall biosynthesis